MRALSAANAEEVAACRAKGEPFWLDVEVSGTADLVRVAAKLGVRTEWSDALTEFGQPPDLTTRDDQAFLVMYGARVDEHGNAQPVEVHIVLRPGEVVTVHRHPLPPLAELHARKDLASHLAAGEVLARITDSLIHTVETIDDEVDDLEDAIIDKPADSQLRRLTELRRALVTLRRVTTPQRDLLLGEPDRLEALPGLSAAAMRNLQARLAMARDTVDSARELVTGALDLYQSTVSTRLNLTGQRLAVIATVVLPLAVVTGFFGQNFGWLVNRIDTFAAFALLGVGAPLLIVGGLLYGLRRGGYL